MYKNFRFTYFLFKKSRTDRKSETELRNSQSKYFSRNEMPNLVNYYKHTY